MIKELAWYIEENRFSNIVSDIEEKAEAYRQSLSTDNQEERQKYREQLRELCQWHIEKSGYHPNDCTFINVDSEFFNDNQINRTALNNFEKEIIKAHMYQKHLWEFMGTTGSMTVISSSAMKKDGFDYEKYLPIEYKSQHPVKSPIDGILKSIPDSTPIFIYPDGTVSQKYDREKAKARFDTLKDKSGFDWSRKGWDPNYEVTKNNWYGCFNHQNEWMMVRTANENEADVAAELPGAVIQTFPFIEIIKAKDGVILYDPGFSLLSDAEILYLLDADAVYGGERLNKAATVSLIKKAIKEMGAERIDGIAGMEPGKIRNKASRQKYIDQYKKLMPELFSEEASIKNISEISTIKKELEKNRQKEEVQAAGEKLSGTINILSTGNVKGTRLFDALKKNKISVPLDLYDRNDAAKAGIGQEEYDILMNYDVP